MKNWLTWLYLLNHVQYLITLNMDWIFNEIGWVYLHINVRSANCFELRIEFVTQSQRLVLEISEFYTSWVSLNYRLSSWKYYTITCFDGLLYKYYTVPRNVSFRCQISLHPGKLRLDILFSFFMFTRKSTKWYYEMHLVLNPLVSTGSRWSGSNLCGILCPRPICLRERALLCTPN